LDVAAFAAKRLESDARRSKQYALAILVIELPAVRRQSRDFAFLVAYKSASKRYRYRWPITDGRVAVLFPDTPKAGAWKVASDICDHYPLGHERPTAKVFLYPDENAPTAGDSQPRATQLIVIRSPVGITIRDPTPIVSERSTSLCNHRADHRGAALVVLAVLIKITSRGPVFYSQWREGLGGRLFRIYKLRTMCVDAHQHQHSLRAFSEQDGPAFKMRHDPRRPGSATSCAARA